ncbi:MAG: alkaline phosphatase D family protein [Bacteroidota bacterium]
MKKTIRHLLLFSLLLSTAFLFSCKGKTRVTKIAFGSCGYQGDQQPILQYAVDTKPDLFIFLGDNIYGDTDNMDTLKAKYQMLADKPEFKNLMTGTKVLATWDDHDFGRNDAGKYYPFKSESKEIFLEFFKEPATSERRKHDGIYHAEYLKYGDKTVQVILLDVRSFRSDLLLNDSVTKLPRDYYFYKPDYIPHTSPDSTLLGTAQWDWLESELKKPADLRLIASGSQFSIEYNGYEAWANFPHEQKRMLDLIKKTKANGVLFLTGDVHYAEISKLVEPGLYPIYDVTSSGITSTWDFATANKNRIEGPIMENHFGLVTIEWEEDPVIKMEIIDKNKNSRIEYSIRKSEIGFK